MKILMLGDFHGTFPKKFEKIIEKEKIELVVSNGDYFPFHYRKLWFKYCYKQEIGLWEVIGKSKYKKIVLKDLRDGEKALKKLNSLSVPVISVVGNADYTRSPDTVDYKPRKDSWTWDDQDFFSKIIKKYRNIKRFDYSYFRFGDIVFIGAYGGSSPGKVRSKAYKKHFKRLDGLFRKFRKENRKRKVIFVSHNVPFNTRLDKIGMNANAAVRGKHYGSKLIRSIISKYHPVLHFGGHIHESRGMQKVGKTLCINPGSAHEGKAAIVEVLENGKIKVKFIN